MIYCSNSDDGAKLDQVMDTNKFLMLPQLSSQMVFDQLCPPKLSAKRKKICVVLLTRNIEEHELYRSSFHLYAQDHSHLGNTHA